MIIGISGYARSGKDSVANILVQDFGFERRAFADKLREALYALNPIIAYDWDLARPIYLGEVISMPLHLQSKGQRLIFQGVTMWTLQKSTTVVQLLLLT